MLSQAKLRHRELLVTMLRTREKLLSQFREVIAEADLTAHQLRILLALWQKGDMEPRQLCEVCVISSPSIVGILNRMESQGLVAKHSMPNDQRRVLVSLTNRGLDLIKRTAPRLDQVYERVGKSIPLKKLHDACVLLNEISDQLTDVP